MNSSRTAGSQPSSGPPRVVVGVDGTDESLTALRYAGAEAVATGAALRLVHVVPDFLPVSPMLPALPLDLVPTGSAVLENAAARVAGWFPALAVETSLVRGDPASRLAGASADVEAAVLVVGRHDRSLLERLLGGSTTTGVAARSTAPVVVVPPGWTGEDGGTGPVVVGITSPRHAPELLGAAFAAAQQRQASVLVLHAWKIPGAYDDIIEARVDLEALRAEAVQQLEHLLERWRSEFPDVAVELTVVHDHAGRALVEASGTARLLVIGRRAHGVPAGVHLGSTARAALRAAHCPVAVVAPVDAHAPHAPHRWTRRERQPS